MTLAEQLIALAILAQAVLAVVVMLQLVHRRWRAFREGTISGDMDRLRLDPSGWPEDARKAQNNLANQFEIPVLFFALALLALVVKASTLPFAIVAWVFVLSRAVHSWIHTGRNQFPLRGAVFSVGFFAIVLMIVFLAIHILANGLIR